MPCCNLSTGSCVYLGKDETLHPTLGSEGDGVMKRAVLLGLLAAGLLVLSACTPKAPGHVPPSPENPAAQPTDADAPNKEGQASDVAEQARKAVQALKEKNLKLLSGLALPDKGIRFSPYGFVDTRNDLVFKPEQLKELFTVKTVYEWGVYDGSGEPIRLTFADYYAKFIYDADFAKAHQTAVNRQIGQGTTRSNLTEVYPPDRYSFVEFHFEGFEAQFEGLDWRSLRLVFEKNNDIWQLVGIIHDQWTI